VIAFFDPLADAHSRTLLMATISNHDKRSNVTEDSGHQGTNHKGYETLV
jgi:hypothetical protein